MCSVGSGGDGGRDKGACSTDKRAIETKEWKADGRRGKNRKPQEKSKMKLRITPYCQFLFQGDNQMVVGLRYTFHSLFCSIFT